MDNDYEKYPELIEGQEKPGIIGGFSSNPLHSDGKPKYNPLKEILKLVAVSAVYLYILYIDFPKYNHAKENQHISSPAAAIDTLENKLLINIHSGQQHLNDTVIYTDSLKETIYMK